MAFNRQGFATSYGPDGDDMFASAISPWSQGYTMGHLPSASSRHSSVGGTMPFQPSVVAQPTSSSSPYASTQSLQALQLGQSHAQGPPGTPAAQMGQMGQVGQAGQGNQVGPIGHGSVSSKSRKISASGWSASYDASQTVIESTPARQQPHQQVGTGSRTSGAPLSPLGSDISIELERKDETIADLKLQVEALVAAMATSSTMGSGTPDGMEMAHRMLTRLKTLRNENERLSRLASGSHAAELEAENSRLKRDNDDLKRQLYASKRLT